MSLLPQRKKSAEEIAKLRESLGVPGAQQEVVADPMAEEPESLADVEEEVETIVATHHEATVVHASEPSTPLSTLPAPVGNHGAKPVHSLKRSERMPVLPVDEVVAEIEAPAPAPAPAPVPQVPKIVRSLKKSEQGPVLAVTPKEPTATSRLPYHRHTDKELNEIRRRDALAMMGNAVPNPKLASAHPAIIIPGYVFVAAGALSFYYYEFSIMVTAGLAAAALACAAFIFISRPISRHHAAFIAVFTLFVIVFGALHYFPQLRHAT